MVYKNYPIGYSNTEKSDNNIIMRGEEYAKWTFKSGINK